MCPLGLSGKWAVMATVTGSSADPGGLCSKRVPFRQGSQPGSWDHICVVESGVWGREKDPDTSDLAIACQDPWSLSKTLLRNPRINRLVIKMEIWLSPPPTPTAPQKKVGTGALKTRVRGTAAVARQMWPAWISNQWMGLILIWWLEH